MPDASTQQTENDSIHYKDSASPVASSSQGIRKKAGMDHGPAQNASLFGAIAVTVANTFLGAAALSALLIHALGAAVAGPSAAILHHTLPAHACLGPRAAIFTHFITLSFTVSSLAGMLIAAFVRSSSPTLSAAALWAGSMSFVGAFCATITALSFMALAQLGCTALGWTAFGLVIGLGGAVPLDRLRRLTAPRHAPPMRHPPSPGDPA